MAKCVGCGLVVNNGILEIDLVGNGTTGALSCTKTGADPGIDIRLCTNGGIINDPTCGLKVSFPPSVDGGPSSILPLGDCLKTDSNGKVTVKLSTDTCNSLSCDGTGLKSPCSQSLHVIDQAGFNNTFPLNVNTAGLATFNFEANREWQICNTMCCNMQGRVMIEAGGLAIDMQPGFLGELKLQQSFDNGVTWGDIFPQHIQWFDNRNSAPGNPNGGVNRQSFNLWHETFWNITDKGLCFKYTSRYQLFVLAGTAVVDTFGNAGAGIEFHGDWQPVFCAPCPDPHSANKGPGFDSTFALSYITR